MNGTTKGTEETIDRCIQDMLSDKRGEIEKSLAEVIEQEREKARQRIAELEQQFQKKKEEIRAHQAMLEEVREAAAGVRARIGKHVEQAGHCRTMVRRLTEQIGEECRVADELRGEIGALLRKADEETAHVRTELETRYGISVPFPDISSEAELGPELLEALSGLARYREGLLALENGAVPPAERPAPAEECPPFPEPEAVAAPEAEPAPLPEAEEASRLLESRLETESVADAGSFRVYRADGRTVLDPGSVLDEMARCVEEARALHVRLAGTKPAKEQYFIKRDILSLQESLRRTIARLAELCADRSCDLPLPVGDVIGEAELKDLQDRLSFGNWSDVHDLGTFEEQLEALRASLTARMSNRAAYDKAILEQLGLAV